MIRPPPNSGHGRPANPGSLNPIPDDQSTEFSFLKTTFFTPDRKRPSRATALGGFIFFYSPDNTLPAMAYFPVRTGTAGSCSTRTVGPDRGTRGRPCRSRSDEGYGRSPRKDPTVLEPTKDTSEALVSKQLRRRPQTLSLCGKRAKFKNCSFPVFSYRYAPRSSE